MLIAYPDLTEARDVDRMGFGLRNLVLVGVAAMPVRKPRRLSSPRCGASRISKSSLHSLGKLLKYGIYGWLAAECPTWVECVRPMVRFRFPWRGQRIRVAAMWRARP